MSLFKQRAGTTATELIPARTSGSTRGGVVVTNETALRHSAVWACLRLRANLISTMPVDLYRRIDGIQFELTKPKLLVMPGGDKVDMAEWLYSTQVDLDRSGNCFGLITERDGFNLPARIDLLSLGSVSVVVKNGEIVNYRIDGELVGPRNVWHERQYTVAGLCVGLSPVAYAAWSIGEYLSIQDFALDWFGNSTVPVAHLKNTSARTLSEPQAQALKERFQSNVKAGQPWVTGNDWEYNPLQAANQQTDWIEGKQYGIADIARFFDCPGDLIDAAVSSGNITYANVTQRNLQFLIQNLNPAVIRREGALTRASAQGRYVKLNTNALLRMDPETQAKVIAARIDSRTLAPSEARAIYDMTPFTEAQVAEFKTLFGDPAAKAALPIGGAKKPTGVTP